MTQDQFRRMALALKGATEGAHMGHPDFRANGRIFATLHADRTTAMVKLTPEQQARFVDRGGAFTPESGAWGRQGCTRVTLALADEETLGDALTLAWQNSATPPSRAKAAAAARRKTKPSSR